MILMPVGCDQHSAPRTQTFKCSAVAGKLFREGQGSSLPLTSPEVV